MKYGDRPDVSFILDEITIGLEITQAVEEELKRAENLIEKTPSNGPLIYNPDEFYDRGRKRTKAELLRSVGSPIQRYQPLGKSDTRWRENVVTAINSKREKLNNDGFTKHQRNWLLIWSYNFSLDANSPVALNGFTECEVFKNSLDYDFDRIIICTGLNEIVDAEWTVKETNAHTFDLQRGKVDVYHTDAELFNSQNSQKYRSYPTN